MARVVLALALITALLTPAAAQSGQLAAADRTLAEQFDISTEGVVMIAAGAAIGALLVHVAAPSEIGAITGGLLGGIAANWWYRHGGEERVRAFLREPIGAAPPLPVSRPRLMMDAALHG